MKFHIGRKFLTAYFMVAVGTIFLPIQVRAQAPSQFCTDNKDNKILLEVTRSGRGMIWPNLITQLFFRLYIDGVIEYDVSNYRRITRRRHKLSAVEVEQLQALVQKPDLISAARKYPLIESLKDAVMKTCVSYKYQDKYEHILIINYMPDHPQANNYYPSSLKNLLKKVSEVRPKSRYEQKYGLDQIGLPSNKR
jgi:hypothetical protein